MRTASPLTIARFAGAYRDLPAQLAGYWALLVYTATHLRVGYYARCIG